MTAERAAGGRVGDVNPPTRFHAEKFTTITSQGVTWEQWAVIMDDGKYAGQLCALGNKDAMTAYAEKLNSCKGILSERKNVKSRKCKDCGQPIKPGRHKPNEYEHASGCPSDKSKRAVTAARIRALRGAKENADG